MSSLTLHGLYEESGKLTAFVTVSFIFLNADKKVFTESGGVTIPGAITFTKDERGGWKLESYMDIDAEKYSGGESFVDSIKKLCVYPVSGSEIPGLAQTMIDDYYSDKTEWNNNLIQEQFDQLISRGWTGISLREPDGSLIAIS